MKLFRKNSVKIYSLIIGMFLLVTAVIATAEFSLNRKFSSEENGAKDEKNYKYHIAMIGEDSSKDSFWKSIYEGAVKEGEKYEMYVENFGDSAASTYSCSQLLKMAVAAKVDGIIVRPDGSEQTKALIQQAVEQEIPVITILEDNPNSKRLSFVTANDYHLGELYGERVVKLIDGTNSFQSFSKDGTIRIAVMVGAKEEAVPNLIYSGLRDYVMKKLPDREINWLTAGAGNGGEFESEETIRNIVLNEEQCPDMLICLNVVDTISAEQCIVDYNLVGRVSIIGYYSSPEILDGIEKGIIDSTIVVDTEELGRAGVIGFYDYFEKGYVSEYIQVDSRLIFKDNIEDYMEKSDE